MTEPVKIDFTTADLRRFKKWRGKQGSDWEADFKLGKQKDLLDFKVQFQVDKVSNYHCPWCQQGRLYYQAEKKFYICRECRLKFSIECLDIENLDKLLEAKAEARRQKREERKAEKDQPQVEGFPRGYSPEIEALAKQAEERGYIECLGCKAQLEPDTEFCTCGWKNPLVSLGLI